MVFPSLISRFAFLILLAVSLSESMMSLRKLNLNAPPFGRGGSLYQEKYLNFKYLFGFYWPANIEGVNSRMSAPKKEVVFSFYVSLIPCPHISKNPREK